MKSIGENHTDRITDETRPSVKQSSVNPIFIANSVANKKNHPPTETPTEIQTDTRAPKKSFPREHYRRNKSVGNLPTALPTENPSVIMAWLVILLQLSV
jgi:hypothetical protein